MVICQKLFVQENREIAKRQAELYTQAPVAQVCDCDGDEADGDGDDGNGDGDEVEPQVTTKTPEELTQLAEDLWVAASQVADKHFAVLFFAFLHNNHMMMMLFVRTMMTQDRAAPAKILLDSGADPNALVSPKSKI